LRDAFLVWSLGRKDKILFVSRALKEDWELERERSFIRRIKYDLINPFHDYFRRLREKVHAMPAVNFGSLKMENSGSLVIILD